MRHNQFTGGTIRGYGVRAFATALLLLSPILLAHPQPAPQQPVPTSAISQSGLLPMFAVDLQIDPAWVDGSSFPSTSTKFANSGVRDVLQRTWDLLKQGGFNIVRFPLNPADTQSSNRLANLCLWAKANGVLLVPVLNFDSAKILSADASANLVKALIGKMRAGSGDQLPAYSQISYYQIGDRLNHAGLHHGQNRQQLQQQALTAAEALRQAEIQALDGSGSQPTPIMVSVSYDYELIQEGLINGVPLDPAAQSKATSAVTAFIAPFASSQTVEAISVEWLPRSVSAGDVDGFAGLLQALKAAAPGKQLVLTTGFSGAFHTADDQQQFIALSATNLADFRAREGAGGAFVGVVFRNGLSGAEVTRKGEPNVSQWQWPQRANELRDFWLQGRGSADIKWWLAKTEANLGLIKVTSGTPPAPLPALQAFFQIATSAQQATQSAMPYALPASSPSSAPPYPGTGPYPAAGAAQYPSTATDSSPPQNYPGQYPGQPGPAGGSGCVGAAPNGGVTGPECAPMTVSSGGSITQQSVFMMLTQFTNLLTTALANRIQYGRSPSGSLAGANSLSGSTNYADSGYPGTQPPAVNQSQNVAGAVGGVTAGVPGTATPAATDSNSTVAGGTGTAAAVGDASAVPPSTGDAATTVRGGDAAGPLPKIVSFGVMTDATPWTVKAGKKPIFVQPMVLQLTNPADLTTAAAQAELQMDNKLVMTRPVTPMLPKQSRSVVFGVPAAPGRHNLQANLKGPQGTVDSASAAVITSATGAISDNSGSSTSATPISPAQNGAAPAGSAFAPGALANLGNSGSPDTSSGNSSGGMVRLTLPGIRRLSPWPGSRATPSATWGPSMPRRQVLPSTNAGATVRSLTTKPATPPYGPGQPATTPMMSGGPLSSSKLPRRGPGTATSITANNTNANAASHSLVRPGRDSSTTKTAPGSTANSIKVPARPGPSSSNAATSSTGTSYPGPSTSKSNTKSSSSALPLRPGPATNPNLVRPGPAVRSSSALAKAGETTTTKSAPNTSADRNCTPPAQAAQQKNLPLCRPGQTAKCAKPICK